VQVAGRSAIALAVAVVIAVTAVACCVGGIDFLMLVGGDVFRPTEVSLVIWSFGVLATLGLIAMFLVRHRHRPAGGTRLPAAVGMVLGVTLAGTGAWCAGQAVLRDGPAALGVDSYTVLPAPADEGCALIAHENGALRTSTGQVYAVDSWGIARSVGSWTADEIERPVHDGTYSLRWEGGTGDLTLQGVQTATPDRLQVTCDR
jgi:hypothetical protein